MRLPVLALIVTAGCSFVAVNGPPAHVQPGTLPSCDTARTVPVIDLVAGSVFTAGLVTLAVLGDPGTAGENEPSSDDEQRKWRGLIALSAVLAVGYFVGAYDGFDKTARCRAARAAALGR